MKVCIIDGCEKECEPGRRYCHEHYLARKREQAKVRYREGKRTVYYKICPLCGKEIPGWRKSQTYCINCYRKTKLNPNYVKNSYVHGGGAGYSFLHRRIAEETLQRKLNTNEVVHHMDGSTVNNDVSNLVIISRANHIRLHSYLNAQRALLSKGNEVNFENCWKSLIVPMTTTWLETANVKVIKIWEIGKPAAEPLESGEGSETMHEAAKHESAC